MTSSTTPYQGETPGVEIGEQNLFWRKISGYVESQTQLNFIDDFSPSPAQQKVIDHVMQGKSCLVAGAPGSGKTILSAFLAAQIAAEVTTKWNKDGFRWQRPVLLLAPTRERAAILKEIVAKFFGGLSSAVTVATPSALALQILHTYIRAQVRETPGFKIEQEPVLISGAEFDALLTQLLEEIENSGSYQLKTKNEPETGENTSRLWGKCDYRSASFRAEIRDLLTRCLELGFDSQALEIVGQQARLKQWQSGAVVIAKYEEWQIETSYSRLDHASMIDRAIKIINSWEDIFSPDTLENCPPPLYSTILVDDYQDMTVQCPRFLAALLTKAGTEFSTGSLVLFGNPDVCTQGFRGGAKELLNAAFYPARSVKRTAAEILADREEYALTGLGIENEEIFVLQKSYSLDQEIRDLYDQLVKQTPVGKVQKKLRRKKSIYSADQDWWNKEKVFVHIDRYAQTKAMARKIQQLHLESGMSWRQMAIICRSGVEVEEIRDALAQLQIPVSSRAVPTLLRTRRAVAPLLAAARICQCEDMRQAEDEDFITVLNSYLVELDRHELHNLAFGDSNEPEEQTTDAELVRIGQKVFSETYKNPQIEKVRQLLSQAQTVYLQGGTARQILWEIWQGCGVAEKWQRIAVNGGSPIAVYCDENLDDVIALFKDAEVIEERGIGKLPEFLAFHAAQELPSDSVAPAGLRPDCVSVLTAAGAAGKQWKVVFVAGLENNNWPNTKIRTGYFQVQKISEYVFGRSELKSKDSYRLQLLDILEDEIRLLACAVSRAKEDLYFFALENDLQRPSRWISAFSSAPTREYEDYNPHTQEDVRELVAKIRKNLFVDLTENNSGLTTEIKNKKEIDIYKNQAMKAIAYLGIENIGSAQPRNWWGYQFNSLKSSITELSQLEIELCADANDINAWQVVERDQKKIPVLYPSMVESILRSPLAYALKLCLPISTDRKNAEFGNLLHKVFEVFSTGSFADENAKEQDPELSKLISQYRKDPYVESTVSKLALEKQIFHFADYLYKQNIYLEQTKLAVQDKVHFYEKLQQASASLAAFLQEVRCSKVISEVPVSCVLKVNNRSLVKIVGRLDRVEIMGARLRVVDLKTGAFKPTKAQMQSHAQLLVYLLMLLNDEKLNKDRRIDVSYPVEVEAVLFYPFGGKKLETQVLKIGAEPEIIYKLAQYLVEQSVQLADSQSLQVGFFTADTYDKEVAMLNPYEQAGKLVSNRDGQ